MSESDSPSPAKPVTRLSERGMSMTFAIVIMVVVILVVGAGGYFGLNSISASKATVTSCSGSGCKPLTLNDGTLFVPYTPGYNQTMTKLTAGLNVSATVGVTGSETIKSFGVSWGDGATASGPTATFNHQYATQGMYVITGNATDTAGRVHTAYGELFPVLVTPSIAAIEKGYYPSLATTFTNGTAGGIYPWAAVGSTVTVNATYSRAPSDPFYSSLSPSIAAGNGTTLKTSSTGATYAGGTFTLNTPGIDTIIFAGRTTNGTGSLTFTFTWAVYVATSAAGLGCSACSQKSVPSPHPGEIVNYEAPAAGGPVTMDPAGDYYTVGYETNAEFLQSLITYNGTDVSPGPLNYVPEVATCVPGTAQCGLLYPGAPGTDLIDGYNYTFVISSAPQFYDPATGAHWGIYPSDVYFSQLRAMAFADLPAAAVYPGWIEAQFMTGPGNPTWDSGLHTPYNNTPGNMLGAMFVNDTQFCPAAAMTGTNHGCITFAVNGGGVSWPAVLSYLAIPSAGGVTPCSWYSSQGATVPGFMGSTGAVQKLATDTGCLLPGGVTSTSAPAFQTWLATQGPTSWDSYEYLGISNYPSPNPSVQWTGAGSGPYYLESVNPGVSVVYKANPYYVQPVACANQAYCQPKPGTFAGSAVWYWEATDTEGIQELTAGYADIASVLAGETSTQLKLVQDGLAGVLNIPSLGTFNYAYNTAIDISSLKQFDPDPVNIQVNSLSYGGLRGFLDAAYPYASVEAQYNVIDGVQIGFNYGGFIPQYMGNYYPTNISWPDYNVTSGVFNNPSTSASSASVVGSALWYWAQATTPGSKLFDPQLAGPTAIYSPTHPLHIPSLFFEGDSTHQAVLALWSTYVNKLSGGEVIFDVFPVASSIVYSNLLPNGQCPWALWFMGWAADYAQPFDYWAAYGAASSTWAGPDSNYYTWTGSQYNNAACNGVANPDTWSALFYWASQPYIPDECQGVAYNVTLYWAVQANHDSNVAQGILEWNRVSSIYSLLDMYANTQQANEIVTYAPWINPASIPTNLIEGTPGGIEILWDLQGNGVVG